MGFPVAAIPGMFKKEKEHMRQMKYIVFERDEESFIIMFPEWISHDNMAATLHGFGKPVRAGFTYLSAFGKLCCGGKSESLGIESDRIKDTALLKRQLGERDQ